MERVEEQEEEEEEGMRRNGSRSRLWRCLNSTRRIRECIRPRVRRRRRSEEGAHSIRCILDGRLAVLFDFNSVLFGGGLAQSVHLDSVRSTPARPAQFMHCLVGHFEGGERVCCLFGLSAGGIGSGMRKEEGV